MDGELQAPYEVVVCQRVYVDQVVDIVDLDLEVFPLLKVILHVETLDPLWREIVANHFGHAKFVPLCANLPVKHYHSVRARKRIIIWQILTSKRKSNRLDQATLVGSDSLVHCGEHRVI